MKQENILKAIIQVIKDLIRLRKNEIMVLRLCKEAGLEKEDTDIIHKVIKCESGFDDRAIHYNRDGSVDNGIVQWNSRWAWEKEKIIHPQEALDNPQKSVEKMIDIFKQFGYSKNGLGRWVCFSTIQCKKV